MVYVLFMVLAIAYNFKKFRKEREIFFSSLIEAKSFSHREMILSHHFYIFIFEGFLALIVAHLLTERSMSLEILELGIAYLVLLFAGFFLYQFFVRYVERHTGLTLYQTFKTHLIRELRVQFAVILLPILVYSLINHTFQDGIYEDWGSLWFIGLLFNIIFVSVLTIVCSVILMLKLIPNREITEPEYLEVLNKRLAQINQPNLRVRWIEADIKNAFVVGLKLLSFSNQTMFIGRSLRKTLSIDEFDAVICHELSHVVNRHIHKRVIDLLKNFISVLFGVIFFSTLIIVFSTLYWGDDSYLHSSFIVQMSLLCSVVWVFFNYALLFDTIRSQEFEADAFAVMELGANFNSLKSSLEKLMNTEELPDYIKKKTQKKSKKGFINTWFSKKFSTHPDLDLRISFLEYKMDRGLPFNHYVSPAQKIRSGISYLFTWRVFLPLTSFFIVGIVWATLSVKSGQEQIAFIKESSNEAIMKKTELIADINHRPLIAGHSLMYHVVKKKQPILIDHFLSHGADKGKTLLYLSMTKDIELFQAYYNKFSYELTDDQFILVMRNTAINDFTEGFRLLVNAKQFETLDPKYKKDVSEIHKTNSLSRNRLPASIK